MILAKLETVRTAMGVDFCRLFSNNIDSLYTLALLLTGKHQAAESCLLAALEECQNEGPVHENEAASQGKWAVIFKAAEVVSPMRETTSERRLATPGAGRPESSALQAIIGLPALDRFAFVVTVLERYSAEACAALLGCQSQDVVEAQIRAMQVIAADLQVSPPSVAEAGALSRVMTAA